MLSLAVSFSALAQAPQAVPVGVIVAAKQPVTQGTTFVGRVEAMQRVEIRARVTGYLDEVLFTEGETVAAGAALYRIEQPPFKAALHNAQGSLLQAQGTLTNATLQRQRSEELVKTSAVSVADRDSKIAAEQQAQGQVMQANADLQTAAINLAYTEITAPIAGRIGRTSVTKGNVVGPQSGVLTQIVSIDPMYVSFPVSQREFLRLEQQGRSMEQIKQLAAVKINFADGSSYDHDGKLNFVDVTVDRGTDTVLVRATVDNPQGRLVDGQFVRVGVQGNQAAKKVVIPQAALVIDQQGTYVFVIQDGKATVRRIKTGGEAGRGVVVEDGLQGGEDVVVEGLQTLRPGAAVTASPARGV
jgi:membrane fusion protein (multidrug efflux system)